MKVEERFLNYVSYWTTSDEEGTSNPTSEREFSLANSSSVKNNNINLEKKNLYFLLKDIEKEWHPLLHRDHSGNSFTQAPW